MKILGPTFDRAKDLGRKVLPAPAWSLLRLLWARYSFGTFTPRIVRHRYGPHELQMELVDFDGAYWYDRDLEEYAEIAFLVQHGLTPGARVFNAGANQCLQAMLLAKAVGPDGFVWAIEPNQRNAQAGRRNLQLNRVTNCEVMDAAVADFDGVIDVDQAMNGQVSVGRLKIGARRVKAITIDSLTKKLGPPDVLYIDIEGFECSALEGARQTLAEHAPDCFVEVHTRIGLEKLGGSVEKLMSSFSGANYNVWACPENETTFREMRDLADFPRRRFFMVALPRSGRVRQTRAVLAGRDSNG